MLARGDAIAKQPELFAELSSIAPVGFTPVSLFGLDEHDPSTAEILQHLQKPIVKTADFDNRPETAIRSGTATRDV